MFAWCSHATPTLCRGPEVHRRNNDTPIYPQSTSAHILPKSTSFSHYGQGSGSRMSIILLWPKTNYVGYFKDNECHPGTILIESTSFSPLLHTILYQFNPNHILAALFPEHFNTIFPSSFLSVDALLHHFPIHVLVSQIYSFLYSNALELFLNSFVS